MSEVDDQIARARATMERVVADYRGAGAPVRGRSPRSRDLARRLTNAAMADGGILFIALMIGLVHPIGLIGVLFVILALIVVTGAMVVRPAERPVRVERLVETDIRALPAQTERWLRQQRAALPAPAVSVADRIGARLAALEPQLARVDGSAPEAGELRKLVAEQLPAFIGDYARVPSTLRGQARNGRTPDMELVDGLTLIDREIGAMSERLAASDLDQLATRGRYLEMRYKDGDEGAA
jgi:hypothetical protein